MDIGLTLNNVYKNGHCFKSLDLNDIFVCIIEEEVTIKLGINIIKGEFESPPTYLATLIIQAFALTEKTPCFHVRDFVLMLRSLGKPLIPARFFQLPIFMSLKERKLLLLELTSQNMKYPPEKVYGELKYSWPSGFWDNMLVDRYSYTFMDFVKFVDDKVTHYDEVIEKDRNVVGQTSDEFLEYIDKEVDYFWSALGKVKVANHIFQTKEWAKKK